MISDLIVGIDKSLKGKLREKVIAICEQSKCPVEQYPSQRKVDLLVGGEKPRSTPLSWGMTVRFCNDDYLNKKEILDSTFLLSENELLSFEELLSPIAEKVKEGKKCYLLNGINCRLEEVFKRANSYIGRLYRRMLVFDVNREELCAELEEYLDLQQTVLQLSLDAQSLENEVDFFELIKNSIKGLKLVREIRLIHSSEVEELAIDWDKILVLPYLENSEELLLVRFHPKSDSDQAFFLLARLLVEMDNFNFTKERFKGLKTMGELWGQAFNSLPAPVALFGKSGELLLHNKLFTKSQILPKDCIGFKNSEKIESGGSVYNVVRKEALFNEEEYILFVFDSTHEDFKTKNNSSEELGIISSSIAHELNNPIAGILAAISVLELEEGWDEDSLEALQDMKSGGVRAQELIKVFLGFSRVSLDQYQTGSMGEAFQHSMDLLRFRMIEANIRLEIPVETSSSGFRDSGNASIRSMIFYLVLNEVLTSFSHLNLISDEYKGTIQGRFHESSEEVFLGFKQELQDLQSLKQSRLIKHLLENQSLEMTVLPKGIKLKTSAEKLLL